MHNSREAGRSVAPSAVSTRFMMPRVLFILLLPVGALGALGVRAQGHVPTAPQLTEILPPVAERGGTADLTLRGTGLGGGRQVLCRYSASPGLLAPTDRGLKAAVREGGDGQLLAHLTVPADAPPGLHELRVVSASGVTNPQYLFVAPYPIVDEKEPNNSLRQANPITVPTCVSGTVGSDGDEDCFSFTARKGDRITFSVDGFRRFSPPQRPNAGQLYLDSFLQLRDAAGRELACDDDSAALDAQLSYAFTADGTYYVTVRDTEHRGRGDFRYCLTVGRQPVVTAVYPPAAQRGERQVSTVYGFNLNAAGDTEVRSFVNLVGLGAQEFRYAASTGTSNVIPLLSTPFPVATEVEPNDRFQDGTPVITPVTCCGKFDRPGDVDAFRFEGQAGQHLVLEVMAQRLGSPVDTFLTLTTRSGAVIARDDDGSGGPDSRMEVTLPGTEEYVVFVRNNLKTGGGPQYFYALTIRPPEPGFSVIAEQPGTKEDGNPGPVSVDSIAVAQNGSARFNLVLRRREGQHGEVAVRLAAVPEIPGLTVHVDPVKNGKDSTPVELSAAPNTPLGTYFDVFLTCKGMAGAQPYEQSRRLWITVSPPR